MTTVLISYAVMALIIFAVSAGLAFFLRHRAHQKKLETKLEEESDEILIGTLADLERAEKEVSEFDLEEKLTETHQRIESFDTQHGFSTDYMEQLVDELKKKNIDATYLFRHNIPGGVTGTPGVFELYVRKEFVQEAQKYIANKLAMKS